MWDEKQSDVVRVYRSLEAHATADEPEKLRRRFDSTSSETVRLAIALRGLSPTNYGGAYAFWLKEHIRSAAEALVELDDQEKLQAFERWGWLDEELTEHLLHLAIEQRRSGMIVWLLRRKEENYDFSDRDFRLW